MYDNSPRECNTTKSLNEEQKRVFSAIPKLLSTLRQQIISYPNEYFYGRGIVLTVGLRQLPYAKVNLKMIELSGTRLPVQIWYSSTQMRHDVMISLLNEAPKLNSSICCFHTNQCRTRTKTWQLNSTHVYKPRTDHLSKHFPYKPAAIISSTFAEVLFLDSDAYITRDPEELFLFDPMYLKFGALFFPDSHKSRQHPTVWKLFNTSCGDHEYELDSAAILVNKKRVWEGLYMTKLMNDNHELFYTYVTDGDKDTFRLGFRYMDVKYYLVMIPCATGLFNGTHFCGWTLCKTDSLAQHIYINHVHIFKYEPISYSSANLGYTRIGFGDPNNNSFFFHQCRLPEASTSCFHIVTQDNPQITADGCYSGGISLKEIEDREYNSIISIIETLSIENIRNDVNQVFRRQVQITSTRKRNSLDQEEKFHKADKDQLPSTHSQTYLLTMLPVAKGDHLFNRGGEQEWEIQRNTDTKFAIYGENLNGAQLSFTTHSESCQWERKDKVYKLKVDASDPHERMSERAFIVLNLPYYNSTLYMCLTPTGSKEVFHQGNRPALKIRVTRRALPVWVTIVCLICLLSFSGLFSGLNLGLMSLTPHDLVVIQEAGTPNDRKYAKKIYPVRKHGNFLLCTILLGNVLVNSTTTILLDTLISGGLAVAGATLAIVIFGEIIPQAICSRHGLKVGSRTILLTRFFMIATFPISYPLSKLLDIILGEEVGARYTRDQMSALLKHTKTTDIEDREKIIMTGVLSLKAKKVRDVMTNLIDVFMLEANRIVDDELVLNVHGYGYSRIPVYEGRRDNIIGLVNIRDFALLDTESGKFTVRNIMNFYKHRYGTAITPDDSSYDVFNLFKKEQYHLGVVVEYDNTSEKDPKAKAIGIITLEDIIEEMIQEEIIDETDVFTDNRRKVRNMLSQAPDFSAFIRTTTNAIPTKISAQMKVAVFQFLSTSVEPFHGKFISAHILSRLLNVDLYKEFEFDEDEAKAGKTTYIYEYGKPVDYFVLIVNGKAELETGKEKIVSEVGSFSYFGVSALYNPDEKVEDLVRLKSNKFRSFIPDFSVRVSEDVQILRIRRVHWLAAVRATYFENKQTASGGAPMLNSDGEQIDLFTQELEQVDRVDPVITAGNIGGGVGQDGTTGGGSTSRERISSLSPTIVSDGGINGTEQEKLLAHHQAMMNLTNSAKMSIDSPNTSGRSTPTLTGKQKRQTFRAETTTPPPSLTGGSSSSKNRSLT